MNDRWLSVDEIADYLGVSRDSIDTWITRCGMPGHKSRSLWKFKTAEVAERVRAGGNEDSARPVCMPATIWPFKFLVRLTILRRTCGKSC